MLHSFYFSPAHRFRGFYTLYTGQGLGPMAAHAYSNDGLGSKTKDMDDTMIPNDEHIFQGEALNHKPVIVKPPENGFKV